MKAKDIIEHMEAMRDESQREILMRFFKTAPGEYGYGDEFLGIKVPQTREVVKAALAPHPSPLTINREPLTINPSPLTIDSVPELLMSKWHEVRLCGLLILVAEFEKQAKKRLVNDAGAIRQRNRILAMYLKYAERANNWDLVDLSAPKILGHWLMLPIDPHGLPASEEENRKRKVVDELADSDCLWKQRISMVCTWKPLQMGDSSWCLRYAEKHLHHTHDLMHKAVGWMLREMGKRISEDLLRDFLSKHGNGMPRTMYRYATEKLKDDDVDKSIHNLTSIGADAMCKTDEMILKIMTSK